LASGKQSKRRRQAQRAVPPPPRVRGARRARRASPKVLAAAGAAVLVLAGLGIGLGIALGGGGSSKQPVPTRGSLVGALPGAADVAAMLKGIPQRGNTLGSASAPVTLVEYIDLQCPYCQQFETQVMPDIVAKYVRPGKVRVVARPIAFIGPDSERGRAAAIAASQQNRMFNLMAILYANQRTENTGWLDDTMVRNAAASIPGFDVPRLLDDRSAAGIKTVEQRYDTLAQDDSVTGTPTFFVGKTGGSPKLVNLSSATDERGMFAALDQALAR